MNLNDMTGAEIRKAMIELGWHSHDSYSTFGWSKWGYSVWFERWDWHRERGFNPCFHSHTDNPDKIEIAIKAAAQKALNAWDNFKDAVPVQLANGSVGEDALATKLFIEKRMHGAQRQ